MSASINTYLKELSYSYSLKKNSDESRKINISLNSLLTKLDSHFGALISHRFVFGSFQRNTILRRSIDSQSDIDLMIVFNHTEYERTPETYRSWLKLFADDNYKKRYGSDVIKSHPTVTVKLNNINFDLVPAKQEDNWFRGLELFIPINDSYYRWQSTAPTDVKDALTAANKKYNNIVKPIIRLLKAWNSNVGYPYDSYDLERKITKMNFYNDNYQSGFFYAVSQLSAERSDSQRKKDKLTRLKTNIDRTKMYLEVDSNIQLAKHWLHKVLPY